MLKKTQLFFQILEISLIILMGYYIYQQRITMQQIKQQQEDIKQKIYKNNMAQSSVEVVDYKKVKKIVQDVVGKEVKKEIKRNREKIIALHQAVVSSSETVSNQPSTSQSDNEITYEDKRLTAKVFKTADGNWLWNYTVRQKIHFDLVETKQNNGVMRFRIKATDEISGKTLKVEDFQSKIIMPPPSWKFYYGLEGANDSIGLLLGASYGDYFMYGKISSNGDKAIGIMKTINFRR